MEPSIDKSFIFFLLFQDESWLKEEMEELGHFLTLQVSVPKTIFSVSDVPLKPVVNFTPTNLRNA